jgi:hypothetical protein
MSESSPSRCSTREQIAGSVENFELARASLKAYRLSLPKVCSVAIHRLED